MNTIAEIEGVVSVTFMERSTRPSKNTLSVYSGRCLREGDECDLRLVDPNNPLESEIDIIAKPERQAPADHQPAFGW